MPDRFTLTVVLSACSRLELISLRVQLHSCIIWSGLASDVCVGCSLVDMYVKCVASGSIHDLRKVLNRMQDHDVMSWTPIITGHVQTEENEEATKLFWEIIKDPPRPHHFTFASVLKACGIICDIRYGDTSILCSYKNCALHLILTWVILLLACIPSRATWKMLRKLWMHYLKRI